MSKHRDVEKLYLRLGPLGGKTISPSWAAWRKKLFLRLGPLGGKTISPSWAAWRAEAPLALRQGQEQTMASLAQQLERNVTKRPKCGECKHADHLFSTSG